MYKCYVIVAGEYEFYRVIKVTLSREDAERYIKENPKDQDDDLYIEERELFGVSGYRRDIEKENM